jgi:hypothetical protein
MTRRSPMQVSIEKLLEAHGFEGLEHDGFYVRFEMPNFDPLVIERLPGGRVAISHYFIQNGHVMYDPEIVFDLATWEPLEITQAPMGIYRRKLVESEGKTYVDTRFRASVMPIVRVWAKNLRWQGWENAEQVKS